MASARNPYGDGHASQRIVAALEHILGGGDAPAPFGPGYDRDAIVRATGLTRARPALDHAAEAAMLAPGPTVPADNVEFSTVDLPVADVVEETASPTA